MTTWLYFTSIGRYLSVVLAGRPAKVTPFRLINVQKLIKDIFILAEGLKGYFEKFGVVEDCVIMVDPVTKRPR